MVEVVVHIDILIANPPGVPTLGIMIMADMTSMQMTKREIIRGYPHVLVGSQELVLILIIQDKKVILVGLKTI
ncbi:hypothetical protein Patl1_21162 [Pistacia atlantica]|uniref:Uncharacterized protein n=1 Tax=Pistacia atlantica TaxID=434234 RepID=A0ACC1BJE4_9ROSI|nr:hypothetical protein Patl1_21162 [Pistacia atlantica]